MNRLEFAFLAGLFFNGACGAALAQAVNAPSTQPPLSQTVREFDQLLSNSEELHRTATRGRVRRDPESMEFLNTIPRFRQATENLRLAVGEQDNLKGALRQIGKLTKPFTNYLKAFNLKASPVNKEEFREYSWKELEWETLTTAERVDNNLQRANLLLRETDATETISITTIQLLSDIHSDLARLKWLSGRLASSRPVER